jgi:hypothetical protein
MRSKAIADQDASSLISSFFGFEVKYTLKPLKANYKVSITRVKAHILPSRGRKRGLATLIGACQPDYHRV